MKTNLTKHFANDSEAEKEGIWVELAEGAAMRVRRYGGANRNRIQQLQSKLLKPYTRQIEKGLLDPDKERAIYVQIFVECAMVDWRGVTDDEGKEIAYDKEQAKLLFKELPELFDFIVDQSTNEVNFREDLGNS